MVEVLVSEAVVWAVPTRGSVRAMSSGLSFDELLLSLIGRLEELDVRRARVSLILCIMSSPVDNTVVVEN